MQICNYAQPDENIDWVSEQTSGFLDDRVHVIRLQEVQLGATPVISVELASTLVLCQFRGADDQGAVHPERVEQLFLEGCRVEGGQTRVECNPFWYPPEKLKRYELRKV